MKIKRLRAFLIEVWEPVMLAAIAGFILIWLMFYRLGNLVPNLSQPEVASYRASSQLNIITKDPLNLPYKIIEFALNHIFQPTPLSLRVVSIVFASLSVALFYYIASTWYNRTTAILGVILFASSAWFLHYARLATPDITLTLLVASLAYGLWIKKTKRSALVGIIGAILAAGLIYTPGLIWFLLIGGMWQIKPIIAHLKHSKFAIPLSLLVGAVLLGPLIYGLSQNPDLIKLWAGLPAEHTPTLVQYIKHTLTVPVQIFLHGPNDPVRWLGRLPLLDLFATIMCILGIYINYKLKQLDSVKLIFGILIVSSLLIGLRGGVSIIILLPFIYLLVLAGLNYLLSQWLSVFPRNPLARTIGVSLITLAVLLACFYNLRHYFVAWPGAPATKTSFRHQL